MELTPADLALLRAGNYAQFATLYSDGSHHVTPLWVDATETHVLVNTAAGRVKDRNVLRDPRVAVALMRFDDPHTWLSVSGVVEERVTGEEAESHIDALSRRYDGRPWSPVRGQTRVLYRVRPQRILRSG
jgi:PPOX class probable F420-dependent enzyme